MPEDQPTLWEPEIRHIRVGGGMPLPQVAVVGRSYGFALSYVVLAKREHASLRQVR
jgi:hypothetical protein